MKKILLGCLFLSIAFGTFAQEALNVFAGRAKAHAAQPFILQLAFAKGDTVIVDYETEKRYSEVSIFSDNNKFVYKAIKTNSLSNFKFVVASNQAYTFKFVGRKMSNKWVDIKIKRIPASQATRYYNTAVIRQYTPDTRMVTLDYDSVLRTTQKREIKTMQVFDKYLHQSVPMKKTSFQLLAAMAGVKATKQFSFSAPTPPDVPNAKFKYWSYTISSKLGGAKHWQMAEIGASVALSFACPAAGPAATLLMDKMGPQEGGEPSDFFIAMDKRSANIVKKKFGAWKATDKVRLYKMGSMTSVYGISGSMKGFDIVMVNHSLAKAKNIKVEISALYYAPYFRKVNAEQLSLIPEVQKMKIKLPITTSTTKLVSAQ